MAQSFNVLKEVGSLDISDNGVLKVGNTGGVEMVFDGTSTLNIDGGAVNDVVRYGQTTQVDVQMDGATDMLWDASTGSLTNGGMFAGWIPNTEADTNTTDASAISVTSPLTRLSTAAAETRNLPDGTIIGQIKTLQFIVDTGNCVVTITTSAGGAGRDVITFDEVGQYVKLMWVSTGWRIIDEGAGDTTVMSYAGIA